MGYLHINNLYKAKEILLFKRCYALEKINGSSANISFHSSKDKLGLHVGGTSYESFVNLFNHDFLLSKFKELGVEDVVVFGEAYGGKMQGMSKTYGPHLQFVAFEVKIGKSWLKVPAANSICTSLGLDFVHWKEVSTDLEELDRERDADSVQAMKNGMGEGHKREGIVLRPLIELTKNNGERIIAKYKRDDFGETKTPRPVNEETLKVLTDAENIAEEWVTEMRLTHVLDKLNLETAQMEDAEKVIKAMIEDVFREGKDEIVESKLVRKYIGKKTISLLKDRLKKRLTNVLL